MKMKNQEQKSVDLKVSESCTIHKNASICGMDNKTLAATISIAWWSIMHLHITGGLSSTTKMPISVLYVSVVFKKAYRRIPIKLVQMMWNTQENTVAAPPEVDLYLDLTVVVLIA